MTERDEPNAALAKRGIGLNKVRQVTAKPSQLPHDEGIAVLEGVRGAVRTGPDGRPPSSKKIHLQTAAMRVSCSKAVLWSSVEMHA